MFCIRESYGNCKRCKLQGNPAAILDANCNNLINVEVVFIGANPSIEDTLKGKPFSDKIGLAFKELLKTQLPNKKWLLSNLVFCAHMSTDQTKISTNSKQACKLNVIELIKQSNPTIIVLLGKSAAKYITSGNPKIKMEYNKFQRIVSLGEYFVNKPLYITKHPSNVFTSSNLFKKQYKADLTEIATFLNKYPKHIKIKREKENSCQINYLNNIHRGNYFIQQKLF